MSIARYVIVLDRYDDDDFGRTDDQPHGHDGTAQAACEQVANELQQAMDRTGMPAGFFNVIERRVIPVGPHDPVGAIPPEDVARDLGIERRMDDDRNRE
jgi:hypothetical protein